MTLTSDRRMADYRSGILSHAPVVKGGRLANPSDSSQGKLQAVAQSAGEVLPYDRAGRRGPHPGWWWRPRQLTGCQCDHCTAARAGAPAYLGYHDRGALVELVTHHQTHAPLYG
jgi:hypothetical protein